MINFAPFISLLLNKKRKKEKKKEREKKKKKEEEKITYCGACGGDASDCDGC
jgi:hypothetical protein